MSTYDKASLVLIPSGTKEGVVFSQKPTNGDGDFTFSRSTAATRVNADGLIEKETQNLLLQSNQFDTTWTKSASDLTSGQSGYDGSNDAWLLTAAIPSGFSSRLNQVLSPSASGVLTLSVYAKANTLDWILLNGLGTNGFGAWFDVSNGVKGQVNGPSIGSKITSIGNGWYRCEVFGNATTLTEVRIYVADGDGTTTANDGDGVYIQDAQLEQGLVARDYIETTTAAVYGGITDNVPRLDYTGGATCPALLLEPSRTNLVTQSEYIDSWSKAGSLTISNNNDTSPEGTQNASLILPNAGSGNFGIINSISKSASSLTYTLSGFAKAKDYNFLILRIDSGAASGVKGAFDLSDGTISTAFSTNGSGFTFIDADIKAHTNNWYRYEVSFTTDSLALLRSIFYVSNVTGNGFSVPSYAANGTDGILFWGAQAEEGSYATSYIPTYGTSVTFAKDFCYGAGNASTFNSEEGVFYFEGSALANDGTNRYLSIDDGTTSNYIYFRYVSTSNNILFRTTVAGVTINTLSTSLPDTTQNHKFAFKWKSGDYAFWIDGVEVGTDTSSTIFSPNVLSNIEFSFPTDGGGGFASNTRQIMIFNTALTDAELIALTTI